MCGSDVDQLQSQLQRDLNGIPGFDPATTRASSWWTVDLDVESNWIVDQLWSQLQPDLNGIPGFDPATTWASSWWTVDLDVVWREL